MPLAAPAGPGQQRFDDLPQFVLDQRLGHGRTSVYRLDLTGCQHGEEVIFLEALSNLQTPPTDFPFPASRISSTCPGSTSGGPATIASAPIVRRVTTRGFSCT